MSVYRTTVTLSHPSLGGIGTNTWHLRTDSIDDAGDAALPGLVGHLRTFYDSINGVFAGGTDIRCDGVLESLTNASGFTVNVPAWEVPVPSGADPLPPATALVVGWKAATGKRRGKGRTFLGPLAKTTLDPDGTPTASVIASVSAAAAALISYSTGLGNGAVAVWSPLDHVARDFTGAAVRDVFASLRSRRP